MGRLCFLSTSFSKDGYTAVFHVDGAYIRIFGRISVRFVVGYIFCKQTKRETELTFRRAYMRGGHMATLSYTIGTLASAGSASVEKLD